MSETVTITNSETHPGVVQNGHAATFTTEPPANDAAPAADGPGRTNNAKPEPAAPKLHKPVDLILANCAHTSGVAMQGFARMTGTTAAEADECFAVDVARKMLCELAHDASPAKVLFALGAVGGPSSIAEVSQRLQAAREAAAA